MRSAFMINRKKVKIKSKKGFTMLEVLISIVVMLLATASLSTLVPYSLSVTNESQDVIKASDLAQNYLENIKSNFKYSALYDAAIAGTTPPISITSEFTDNNSYTVTTKITNLETQIVEGSSKVVLKEVDVNYCKSGSTKTLVRLTTMLSRPR
jgi:prepilin-type N-terminal cleavage/methylation domain-containing protein